MMMTRSQAKRKLKKEFLVEIRAVSNIKGSKDKIIEIIKKYERKAESQGLETEDFIQIAYHHCVSSRDSRREKNWRQGVLNRIKKKEDKHLGKALTNILSPSSYNYLKLKTKKNGGSIKFIQKAIQNDSDEQREITFEVDHISDKSEMMIDFLFDQYAKKDDAILLKRKPRETDIISVDKFGDIINNAENYTHMIMSIKFESNDVRKHLGTRITDKEIRQTINELRTTTIKLDGVKIWLEKDGQSGAKKYKKVTHEDSIVDSLTTEETGWVAPRTKDPQHRFIVRIGIGWALIFHNNIINKRYACFPKEFYKAGKRTRALGRYLSCWKQSTLTIEKISEIMEYSETTNLSKRKKDIESKLEELKNIGVIKKYERVKKGGKELTGKNTAWKFKKSNADLVIL